MLVYYQPSQARLPHMQPFLHIVADYGTQDPSFGEVLQRLHGGIFDLQPTIFTTSVAFSDTMAGGFWIYQYALGKSKGPLFIYGNIAPRRVQRTAMKNNSGEGLKYAKLANGTEIVAVNSEYVFSFVKPYMQDFKEINVSNQGTQFRSRDNYPTILSSIMHGKYESLAENLSTSLIPDVPKNRVAWTDGCGNIKTTIRKSQVPFPVGTKVRIELNGVMWSGIVADGTFSVNHGELAFSPGSSGYEDPFMEIFLRRHIVKDVSASDVFNHPINGSEITITEE